MENVKKRYNLHVNDYNEARDALETYRSNLSNEGIKFLNELINDINKHG
jgi:hypothetical protein